MSPSNPDRQKRTRRVWATISIVLIAATLIVSLVVIKPAVPNRITLLTGPEGGAYYNLGLRYAEDLQKRGLEVDVETTAGVAESLERLADGGSVVAFSPSIIDRDWRVNVDTSHLVSLGSVGFEPLWLFYRSDLDIGRIPDLAGRTIHTGAPGTVSDIVARKLIEKNGLGDTVTLRPTASEDIAASIEPFADGSMEVLLVAGSPDSPIVGAMLQTDGVSFLSFERGKAYAGLFPGLTTLVAPEGVFDLVRNLPPRDSRMLLAVTCLVAHEDLHSAVVPMLLETAGTVYRQSMEVAIPAVFPSDQHVPFPLDAAARRYFSDGETGLARILPYKLVRYLNHIGFMVVPLLAIVVLLLKIVPTVLRVWIGIRFKRWFIELAAIEKARAAGTERDKLLTDLDRVDQASAGMFIPRASAQDYVDFRQFLSDLRERVRG